VQVLYETTLELFELLVVVDEALDDVLELFEDEELVAPMVDPIKRVRAMAVTNLFIWNLILLVMYYYLLLILINTYHGF
jgi:hypothetical protein